ncbi:DUF6994 family protein [Microcella flavibacter]|uniref:DUF6994 family protein n=1 Tax=Microcella flavibacter TaxID=1804990 RepID=UPI00145649A3|nr:hypothetical protein [Microcella flavibacter]
MSDDSEFDPYFDSRDDAGKGDPDSTSKRLRRQHQLLWSKPLPNGDPFDLVTTRKNCYLFHESDRGRFFLSSDTVVPTFRSWLRMKPITEQLSPDELDEFQVLNHSMAGAMVFPGERRPGSLTINGARGMDLRIADRMDLTLEAIRRHYAGEQSPLSKTLDNYRDFFELFEDFHGYVEHFLLQDLVDERGETVRLFTPFDDFGVTSALPQTVDAYRAYRDEATAFLHARNRRMADWAAANLR